MRYPVVGAVFLLAGLAGCGSPPDRERWDFERMRRQARADPFEASSFFADGMVMRPPPAGTVAFDSLPDAAPGRVPMLSRAEGAHHYAISCRVCHGAAGYGGTSMAANLPPARAFSLRTGQALRHSPPDIVRIIETGIGRMPALAWQLDPPSRRAVAEYAWDLIRTPIADSAGRADSLAAVQLSALDSAWFDFQRRRAREAGPP